MRICVRCNNLDKDIQMNLLKELTLCCKHKKDWKFYKKRFKIIEQGLDRLLNAIENEIESRRQIGKI